jgi:transcriptional regulator with XRE-family HTH domain
MFLMRNKVSENIVDSVVRQLTEARKEQQLSHETVAKRAGVHRSTISLIESRNTQATLLTFLKVASALDCSLGKIVSQAEKENKKDS